MNVGVLARVAFDEGSLTGTITESTEFDPKEFRGFYFRGDRKKQVVEHVAALERDLAGVDGSLAEIALRFTISHPAVMAANPSMRPVRQRERNSPTRGKGAFDEATLPNSDLHTWGK